MNTFVEIKSYKDIDQALELISSCQSFIIRIENVIDPISFLSKVSGSDLSDFGLKDQILNLKGLNLKEFGLKGSDQSLKGRCPYCIERVKVLNIQCTAELTTVDLEYQFIETPVESMNFILYLFEEITIDPFGMNDSITSTLLKLSIIVQK